ncbi:MAG: hypothetical protein LKJ14_01375 [Lactobacillus amylovorus]|jgi:hypothetical protein|nr:hypothetical protein [Lactobacillus amylovorus]
MNDNRNKKVSEEKSKKVTKGSRKISDAADNRIAESLKPYVEINKVASKIAKPYLATNNIVPKVGEAYSVLENLKTNRLGALPTVNTAWQKYLKQTEIPSNRFNSALRANTAWQTYLKQTEIPSNRFNSALGANTVWQEYLKRAENTANIFRNAIKPFKANNAFTKNYSQIVEVSDRFQKLVERTIGKHSENLKVAKLLMKNGWVTSEFFYNSVLRDNYDKTEKDVLEYVEKFYTENNYQKFFRVFDLVIEGFKDQGLNEGYRLTLVKIRKLLKQDFDNYDLFMNITFEYLCSFKFGILSTNDYIKEKSIGTARKKYADKNGQLTKIDIMSMFGVLKSWWKKINFKKWLDRTDFGRSPIEHGRYDPRRYKRTDFIKLILFMFNVLMAPDPDVES